MSDYFILITDAGAALETAAHAAGAPLILTEFVVCDGGVALTPDPTMTSLPNESYRGEISSLTASTEDPRILVAQCIVPASSGGYTIRGIGIYAGDTLYAVGNYPDQPKPAPESGFATSLEILAQLAVSDTADVTLNVTDGAWLTKEEGDQLYVPLTRTINGHALDRDLVLTPADTGALPLDGNAASATKLQTGRKIGGVVFDGTADINLPGVNAAGNQSTTGNAASATKLQTAHKIGGVAFDGTADINLPGVNAQGNQNTTGNAASATKLQTGRKIGGVVFDGTADINLPGVNAAGNQSTTGNAASATKLQTARTINGVAFDGTKNITISSGQIGAYTKAESDGKYQLKNTASKAANGWHKDTITGVITQWGFTNNSTDNNTYIKFPIAFPSACTACVTIPKGSPGWSPGLVQFVYAISKTSCNISAHDNNTSRGQYWIAYGY